MKYRLIAGSLFGFTAFLVETTKVGGIYVRPNEKNKLVFTTQHLKGYIKAPFKVGTPTFDTVWALQKNLTFGERIKMLKLNWIVMTGFGAALATASKFFF